MDSGLLMQYLVVALAVATSAAFLVQRQWPGAVRRLRTKLALWLLREGRGMTSQRLGRSIAPASRMADAGCGGCSGCNSA